MTCPACSHDNPSDAKFCNACGAKLELACPRCGSTNSPDSRFCNGCGQALTTPSEIPSHKSPPDKRSAPSPLPGELQAKILAQRGRIEGERRQVTVLFCDLEQPEKVPTIQQI